MAVRSGVVTVGTSPTSITPGTDSDSNVAYRDVVVQNTGATPIYIGGSNVNATAGFPLAPGAGLSLGSIMPDSLPFAVVASGTATLAVLEVGV